MVSILDRMRGRSNLPIPPQMPDDGPDVFEEMTLQEHLEELRSRIVYAAMFVAVGFVVGLIFAQPLMKDMVARSNLGQLYTIAPLEGFTTYFKVALYIGVVVAMPALIYHIVRFLAPGLTRKERRYLFRALPFVMVMFVSGLLFAYFIIIPRGLRFLHGFGGSVFEATFRAEEVVSFYTQLLLWIGIVFELPVVIYLIVKLGIVSVQRLAKLRKYVLIVVMIGAAIITPTPDPFNMMLVATPMYALYEIGMLIARFARPDRQPEET